MNKNKLRYKWSKREKDFMVHYPSSPDGHLIHSLFAHTDVHDKKNILKNLEERGYDLKTLKFEVTRHECYNWRDKRVAIEYHNHRGHLAFRVIDVARVFFGTSEYYREPQVLIEAFDTEKQETRTFAYASVRSWNYRTPEEGCEHKWEEHHLIAFNHSGPCHNIDYRDCKKCGKKENLET